MGTSSLYKMISIPEAQGIVLDNTLVLPPEEVSLSAALGRVLGETVTARDPLPPFAASIKDGYAVIASDGPGEFDVVGESRAGHMDDIRLTPGSVAYITTGAPVPPGADSVVQVEDTQPLEPAAGGRRQVRILKAARPGQDIRPVGSDIEAGALVLQRGELVGVAEVGILATVGATALQVHRRPRLGVLSTGDEVVEPSTVALGPGQIRDCNRSLLLAGAAQAGAEVTDLGIARDAEGHLEGCLTRAIEQGLDVLVTSGGVSMGDKDLVKPLLERNGRVHFGRVCMKPGKPLTFATVDLPSGRRMLVFGLPGNPVSSFVCFSLVVVPALRKMAGWPDPTLRRIHVHLTSDLRMDPERPEYHRTTVHYGLLPTSAPTPGTPAVGPSGAGECGWVAVSTGNQISSRLLSARSANALVEVPRAEGVLKAGSIASALLIDDLRGMPAPGVVAPTPGFA